MKRQTAQPIVQSMEASIPEVQAKYLTESTRLSNSQSSLEQRYDNHINEIKCNQAKKESRTSTATSREHGRRGISSQGGL